MKKYTIPVALFTLHFTKQMQEPWTQLQPWTWSCEYGKKLERQFSMSILVNLFSSILHACHKTLLLRNGNKSNHFDMLRSDTLGQNWKIIAFIRLNTHPPPLPVIRFLSLLFNEGALYDHKNKEWDLEYLSSMRSETVRIYNSLVCLNFFKYPGGARTFWLAPQTLHYHCSVLLNK